MIMNRNFLFALLVVCCVPLTGCIQTPLQIKQETPMLIKNVTDNANISVADLPAMPQRAIEPVLVSLPNYTKINATNAIAPKQIDELIHKEF